MNRRVFFSILSVFFAGFVSTAAGQGLDNPPPRLDLPTGSVEIMSQTGRIHRFSVEYALTPESQARGLMFREDMPAGEGMLFVFNDVRPRSFWMRNTLIPLDIIFIDPEGRIINIEAMAEPLSEESRPSDGPAAAVLEINGGLSAMLGIRPGDILRVTEGPS